MASAQTTEAAHYAMSQPNAAKAYYSSLLDNPNVQRGLNVIRTTEGTAKKKDPYSTAFGGGTIKSLRDHPRKSYSFTQTNGKKNKTTAAGAYQFLSRTWDGVATKLGLKDFTKKSQDIAALALIDARQGLDALLAGDIRGFISAVGPEWASLPTAPDAYSQPRVGWNKIQQAWDSTVINAPGPISPAAIAAAYSDPSRAKDVPQVSQETIAAAYRDPMRGLDVLGMNQSPSRLASQYGQYRPGTVPAPALPSVNAVRPSVPGSMPAARPTVNAVRPSVTGSLPAARPSALATQAARPALSVGSLPAARQQTTVATRPSTPAPTGLPARSQTTVATRPATPAPTGLPAARAQTTVATRPETQAPTGLPGAAPSTADLAAQYGQYRTPTTYTNVRNAMLAPVAPPAALPPAPVAPVTPPALSVPPAQVLAPLLAPPKVVKDYPVAEVQPAPAPPRATAYDVYSGMADSALDNTGLNTVSSMPGGGTSVTNQYGATTGMKNGYQTAVGSLPGITGPTASKFGSAVKGAIPGVAGSALGGLLGGPVGALLGAALAKAVTQPGGLLSKQNSFQTDYFGTLNAAKAKGGLGFPGAPSGGYGTGGRMGASFSNNSRGEMDSISPGASAAIGKGLGGLY
jgi:muramidase (phage lysozyme)